MRGYLCHHAADGRPVQRILRRSAGRRAIGSALPGIQRFLFVLAGEIELAIDGTSYALGEEAYALLPTDSPKPDDFNPERFEEPVASAHLIWPRGRHDDAVLPEDRTCPGNDISVLIAKLFAVNLLRDFDWQLSTRKQRWEQRFFSLNVAAPVGPLEVKTFRRR